MHEQITNISAGASERNEQIESKEEILLQVIIQRHGPKLSASGEKNQLAAYFAESVKQGFKSAEVSHGEGLVHVSSSPVQRAVDTAKIDIAELAHTSHRVKDAVVNKESLAVPFQPVADAADPKFARDLDVIVRMQKTMEPGIRESVVVSHPDLRGEEMESEVRNAIDMEVLTDLFLDENSDKKSFETSYRELADKFASRYKGFLRHIGMLKKYKESDEAKQPEGEPYVQVDISHSFPVTCFLKEYLVFDDGVRAKDLSPEDFFERTGGIIRESGSLKMEFIQVTQNGKNDEEVEIHIRGSFTKGRLFSGKIIF